MANRTHRAVLSMAFAAAFVMVLAGCTGKPVGRKCFIGGDTDGGVAEDQVILASPALECPSRTCLHIPRQGELPEGSEYADLCTDECKGEGDCDRVPESPCVNGFTCAVATTVGPFCCRKMCICKDYLIIPDGGVPTPAACDPNDDRNTCINLPGR